MTNRDIAAIFDRIADLLEFQSANPFRVRAYRNGARKIGDLNEPLSATAESDGGLTSIDGIGKDLAEKIATLLKTGSLPMLDDLLADIPATVLAILRVPGLGPKRAAIIHNELGVNSLEELRKACESQQVRDLKGFGTKTEQTILKGIDIAAQADVRTKWAKADVVAQELLKHMQGIAGVRRMQMAGSYRRGRETVGDLDLLIDADDGGAAMTRFGEFPSVKEVIVRGGTKMSVRLDSGLQVDLRVVPERSFGAALQYFTGSKDHNVEIRSRAKQRGMKVNEWGVFKVEGEEETYLAGATEEEIYATLDLPWFPPEIREARREFELAEAGPLPKLIKLEDIRGDLHMHTNASDGKATLEEMAEAAIDRGLEYIAITDHSQRVSMANGLDGKRLLNQWKAVDKLNDQLAEITLLKGIECDILEAGGMDLPDEVLAQADWVIASVHYGQNQPREKITERILGALENPYVDIVAHPTGRLINRRERYEVDIEAVFAAAAKHKKMLELNANPARLDLDDVHCAAAKRHGVPIVISTDAHHTGGLDVMRYGILQARRAGLTANDVANTRTFAKFKKLLGE
ncbi:DNA polymerase/3'-5' exonuclease PolX [Adhaeretor mobilis]|uniref:DNA polymerase beta n=1 Tax=Adhaeretor mobilis TaxID=1930276 RepID=A0A517MVX6_9BACT|nr:DNA polymerase/3'-5' exonuclease PolX [Adhaeretor mobilis]QDS99030.1 DNA polymerase/3'-5' exonuclease PolX [Adhaeretor mobilis]